MRNKPELLIGIMLLIAASPCLVRAQGNDGPAIKPFQRSVPPSLLDSLTGPRTYERSMRDPIDNMPILHPPDTIRFTGIVINPAPGNIDNMPILGRRDDASRPVVPRGNTLPDTVLIPKPNRKGLAPRGPDQKSIPMPRKRR